MACKSAEFSGSDHLHPGNSEGVTHALVGEYRKLLACAHGNPDYQHPPELSAPMEGKVVELAEELRTLKAHTLSGALGGEIDLPAREKELERELLESLIESAAHEDGSTQSPADVVDGQLGFARGPHDERHDGSLASVPVGEVHGEPTLSSVQSPEGIPVAASLHSQARVTEVLHRGTAHRTPQDLPHQGQDGHHLSRIDEVRETVSVEREGSGIDSYGHRGGTSRELRRLNLDRLSDGWPFLSRNDSSHGSEEIQELVDYGADHHQASTSAQHEQEQLNWVLGRYVADDTPQGILPPQSPRLLEPSRPGTVIPPLGQACVRVLAGELKPKSAARAHGVRLRDLEKTIATVRGRARERLDNMACTAVDRHIATSLMSARGLSYDEVAASKRTDVLHVGRVAQWLKQNVLEDVAHEVVAPLPAESPVRTEPKKNPFTRMISLVKKGFSGRRGATADASSAQSSRP